MAKYLYNGQEVNQFVVELKKIDELMKSSYDKADKLRTKLIACEWEGRSHDAMVAFMDLTVQYHDKFHCEGNPIDAAINDFGTLDNTLTEFYRKFSEYLKLSKI